MQVIEEAPAAAAWSANERRKDRSIGFVPTMGALHAGHIALVKQALAECRSVAASIFVNPLQFNNPEDLRHYPRRLEEDLRMLEAIGCHMVFTPSETGIYHLHTPRRFDLGGSAEVLEGPSRPGHFQGVVNAVERLFNYVRPDRAFFGEKDRQQLAVINHVARRYHWPERIVACPTVRDTDGLALSSRNQRLSPSERAIAPVLFRNLVAIRDHAFLRPVDQAREAGEQVLATEPAVRVDYLVIAHPTTLEPLVDWGELDEAVALVAAWLGPVRLIDNITLHRSPAGTTGQPG